MSETLNELDLFEPVPFFPSGDICIASPVFPLCCVSRDCSPKGVIEELDCVKMLLLTGCPKIPPDVVVCGKAKTEELVGVGLPPKRNEGSFGGCRLMPNEVPFVGTFLAASTWSS
jgi:hypothetical protein